MKTSGNRGIQTHKRTLFLGYDIPYGCERTNCSDRTKSKLTGAQEINYPIKKERNCYRKWKLCYLLEVDILLLGGESQKNSVQAAHLYQDYMDMENLVKLEIIRINPLRL